MQRVIQKTVLSQLRLSSGKIFAQAPMRMMSKSDVLNDKEKGDERIFFNKNDGKCFFKSLGDTSLNRHFGPFLRNHTFSV